MNYSYKFASAALLAATALCFSGCQDEDFGFESAYIAYQSNFAKQFGKIDPLQTWNAASRYSVDVTPSSNGVVKIYAKNGAGYQLMASFDGISGSKKLNFDALDGTKEVMVTDGLTSMLVPVGGSANLASSTRAVHNGSSLGIKVSTSNEYREFTYADIKAYTRVAPEEHENTTKVTCNYTLISNGEFILYPVYFETGSWSTVGVYYKDAGGGINRVDVYSIKDGDEFQYYDFNTHYVSPEVYEPNGWTSFNHNSSSAFFNITKPEEKDPSTSLLRSKGIKIDIPAGTVFGMYLRVESNSSTALPESEQWCNYSEAELNKDTYRSTVPGGSLEYINSGCINEKLAAFYTVDDYTYFSFEDWSTACNDLNDIVFMFGGNIPTSMDTDATEWLVACEDMSETSGDNDFNDFVFKVSHGTNYTTMNVTPLAAVGTYKSELYYNSSLIGEVHQLINPNAQPASNGLYSIINGYDMDEYGPGQQKTIAVNADFTMASYTPENWTGTTNTQTNMGNFSIKCYRQDGTGTEDAIIVSAPERGNAPAMFCVPATYQVSEGVKGVWVWPKESNGITTAYEHFSSWVSNHSDNQDWYQHMNRDHVVSGNYLIAVEQGSGSGSSLNALVPMKVDRNNIEMTTGDNASVNVVPGGSNGTLSVVTGNSDIATATLNGNVVTINAVSAGTATVTIMLSASLDGKYAQQQKVVNVKVYAGANTLTIDQTALELNPGSSNAVELTYSGKNSAGDLSVSSSNTDVATVALDTENSKITITPVAVSADPITITLHQDASVDYPAKDLEISVTVVKAAGPEGYTTELIGLSPATNNGTEVAINDSEFAAAYQYGATVCVIFEDYPVSVYELQLCQGYHTAVTTSNVSTSSKEVEFELTAANVATITNLQLSKFVIRKADASVFGKIASVWIKAKDAPAGDDPANEGYTLSLNYGTFNDSWGYLMYDMSSFTSSLENLSDDDDIVFTITRNEGKWGTMEFVGCNSLEGYANDCTKFTDTDNFNGGTKSTITLTYSNIKNFSYIGFRYVNNGEVTSLKAKKNN